MSSLSNFTLDISDLSLVGKGLNRPESVLVEKNGTVWTSSGQGGVTRIDPNGQQENLGDLGGEANGLAMDKEGNFYVANIGDGNVYKLYRDGHREVVLSEIDGNPLGSVNYVFIDSKDRLWVSVLTRTIPWFPAINTGKADGYIIRIDQQGAQIVADNILFCNEIRMDAREEYLYAAETMANHILRFPVREDGSLGEREIFGPEDLGQGAVVDGFAFDAEGNLWVTTITRNGLMIITPEGKAHTVFEDPQTEAIDRAMDKIKTGELTPEGLFACMGQNIQFPTSVAFGGPDLKTVYMGSLGMTHLLSFKSPVAGLPMYHWR
ncbi:MAG TPA: SMP-30/gluconolactonase/LRE family protein [Chloroflexia bacterium]|nr:SMP-30/gluconolactonase/LRE family protein [Chloroflexia bacterium]